MYSSVMTSCEVWSRRLLGCIAVTASAASSVGMSLGKDEGMLSRSTLHLCLRKVKDVQGQAIATEWQKSTKEFLPRRVCKKKKKKKAGMEASNNGGEMLNVILGCWHGDYRKHKCHCKEIYVSSLNGWSKYKSFGKNSIKGPLFTQQV